MPKRGKEGGRNEEGSFGEKKKFEGEVKKSRFFEGKEMKGFG